MIEQEALKLGIAIIIGIIAGVIIKGIIER